jgi:hypothetical protein
MVLGRRGWFRLMTGDVELIEFTLQTMKLVFSVLGPEIQVGHLRLKTLLLLEKKLVLLLLPLKLQHKRN